MYENIKAVIEDADAIVIGAGAGLSTAAGLEYSGERFEEHFGDFIEKYHITDMYSAGFYPYPTEEEKWAFWSRHIYYNRIETKTNNTYDNLLRIVKDKDYFVLTTNVDHQFQKASFDKERLFYTQGDMGLWQCSKPCHHSTYDNEEIVKKMVEQQKDMKVPSEIVPKCPKCGRPMAMNLRIDNTFVEDNGWHQAAARYEKFIENHQGQKILFLELGVGFNSPVLYSLSAKMKNNKIVRKQPISEYFSISLNYNNERRAA